MGTERLRPAPNHKAMPLREELDALFVLLQGYGAAEGRKEHHGGVGLLQRLRSFGTEQYYRDCAFSELNFGTEHCRDCALSELNSTTETVLFRN